jgi:hypothetical protein
MRGPGWYQALPRWVRETVDQSLHVVIGAVAASVLWIAHPVLAGLAAALWAAAVREREQWPPARWWDLVLDVIMVCVGGVLMGFIILGVA